MNRDLNAMGEEAVGAFLGALAPALLPPRPVVSAEERVLDLEEEAAAANEVIREVAKELAAMASDAFEYVGRHPARGHRGGAELEALAIKLRDLMGASMPRQSSTEKLVADVVRDALAGQTLAERSIGTLHVTTLDGRLVAINPDGREAFEVSITAKELTSERDQQLVVDRIIDLAVSR